MSIFRSGAFSGFLKNVLYPNPIINAEMRKIITFTSVSVNPIFLEILLAFEYKKVF